jgi:hypothetical protein
LRSEENSAAIGGRHSPHLSAQKISNRRHRGKQVHAVLSNTVQDNPWLDLPGIAVLGVRHIPQEFAYPRTIVQQLRDVSPSQLDQTFNALWEALAMLVALRSWRSSNATALTFQGRSDSLSALSSILKVSSRSRNLNNVVTEILLHEAKHYNFLPVKVHIPGIANIQPNALSRFSAPSPSTIPQALHSVPRLQLRPRDDSFSLTQRPERKEAKQ